MKFKKELGGGGFFSKQPGKEETELKEQGHQQTDTSDLSGGRGIPRDSREAKGTGKKEASGDQGETSFSGL